MSGSQIAITSVRIVDNHAEYAVERDGPLTRVWRRYREFESLRNVFLLDSPAKKLIPKLPSKQTWWASRSDQVVNQRRIELQSFLRQIEDDRLVYTENRKSAWEAFFDVNTSNQSVISSTDPNTSTYLDARDAPSVSTSLESSLNQLEHSENLLLEDSKQKDGLSEVIKRLELEVERLKSSPAFREEFVKGLQEDREESKQLRARIQYLESEIQRLRESPGSLSIDSTAKGNKTLARNEESSASLPSLESEQDQREISPNSEFTRGTDQRTVSIGEPSLESASYSLEGLRILSGPGFGGGGEQTKPQSVNQPRTAAAAAKEEGVTDKDQQNMESGSYQEKMAVGGLFGAMVLTSNNKPFVGTSASSDNLASQAVDGSEDINKAIDKSIALSLDGNSSIEDSNLVQNEQEDDKIPSVVKEISVDGAKSSLHNALDDMTSFIRVKSTATKASQYLVEDEYTSSSIMNNTTLLGNDEQDENVAREEEEEEKNDKFRYRYHDTGEESFLAHVDDEITPSVMEAQEEGDDEDDAKSLSDLSAIPVVAEGEEEDDGIMSSVESSFGREEDDYDAQNVGGGPTQSRLQPGFKRTVRSNQQQQQQKMPPLPPISKRQDQEKRPPLVHAKTPVKVAKKKSPFRTHSRMNRSHLSENPSGSSFSSQNSVSNLFAGENVSMESVIQTMRMRAEASETVARLGCKMVLNLASESKESCERLGRLGACEVVLNALDSFPRSEQVAVEASGAICNLAFDEWNAQELRNLGAFKSLVYALSRFGSTNQAVAYAGLSACLNLIADKESARKFGRSGGARASLSCLIAWGQLNRDIALEGCVAVRNLSEELTMARELGRLGACDAVVRTLHSFGLERRDNALEALIAIRNLCIDDANRMAIFRTNGALSARMIVLALDVFGKDDELFTVHGCLSIRNITSKNEDNAKVLSYAGACEVIVGLGLHWTRNQQLADPEDFCYAVTAAIWNLAFDPSAARGLLKHHVSKWITEAVRICGGTSTRVGFIACGAIFRLVETLGIVARRDLLRAGIMNALRNSCPNENLQAALEALDDS